jgi:hypothetical protein
LNSPLIFRGPSASRDPEKMDWIDPSNVRSDPFFADLESAAAPPPPAAFSPVGVEPAYFCESARFDCGVAVASLALATSSSPIVLSLEMGHWLIFADHAQFDRAKFSSEATGCKIAAIGLAEM